MCHENTVMLLVTSFLIILTFLELDNIEILLEWKV